MKGHVIRDDDHDELAYEFPADPKAVHDVLEAPVGTGDGRSGWTWLRLRNGDLMLGVWPQGETYFEVETMVEQDYKRAFENE